MSRTCVDAASLNSLSQPQSFLNLQEYQLLRNLVPERPSGLFRLQQLAIRDAHPCEQGLFYLRFVVLLSGLNKFGPDLPNYSRHANNMSWLDLLLVGHLREQGGNIMGRKKSQQQTCCHGHFILQGTLESFFVYDNYHCSGHHGAIDVQEVSPVR